MSDILRQAYKLISDMFAYPEGADREDGARRAAGLAGPLARLAGDEAARLLADFAGDWRHVAAGEYIETFELNPKCPLYIGCYTCKEGGPDGRKRRAFMCDMIDIYVSYGLRLEGREYPDFLPVALECLWYSLDSPNRAARTTLIRDYVLPGLPEMEENLAKISSPYARLVRALKYVLEYDLETTLKEEARHAVPA